MSHPNLTRLALSYLLLAATALGCTTPDPDDGSLEPGPEMKIRFGCLKTQCQYRRGQEARACADCSRACFSAGYDCDVDDACEYSCEESRPCSDWEREECVSEGWQAVLPNDPDGSIESACLALIDTYERCGFDVDLYPSECARWAASEKPEVASYYQCVATQSCDALAGGTISCAAPVRTAFGDAICADFAAVCGEGCNSDFQEWLNVNGSYWREDVLEAAEVCVAQSACENVSGCLEAWAMALSNG